MVAVLTNLTELANGDFPPVCACCGNAADGCARFGSRLGKKLLLRVCARHKDYWARRHAVAVGGVALCAAVFMGGLLTFDNLLPDDNVVEEVVGSWFNQALVWPAMFGLCIFFW